MKRPGHKRLSKQRPAEEHVKLPDGVVPAIVSPETWETAQHCITHWSTDTARNATSPYLLRGMIYCERCEQERGKLRKMHTYWRYKSGSDPTSPKIRCYRCTSFSTPLGSCGAPSIRAEQIEAEVWATLCKTLRHPELVADAIERQRQAGTDTNLQEDLAKAERAIARLEGKQQELLEKYTASEDDAFPWELVQREVRRLEKEKREWEHTARQVEHRMQRQEAEAKQLLHVQDYCRRVTANLETADFAMRVEILRALHIKVIAQGSQWHALGLLSPEEGYRIEQTPS